jgi:hypothetical protein
MILEQGIFDFRHTLNYLYGKFWHPILMEMIFSLLMNANTLNQFMETLKYPLATTTISLSADAFTLVVIVGGDIQYTITEDTGIVGISTDGIDVLLTIPGTALAHSTTLIWNNTRSFKIAHQPTATCVEDGIGVVDFRDLRITYWWCISACPISLQLTKVPEVGSSTLVPGIVVWRSSDSDTCYSETSTKLP